MDQYGHNPFSTREPNLANPQSTQDLVDFSDLGRFDKLIQRYRRPPASKRIPLWLSEYTIPTFSDSEFNYHVTPKVQAKWITSAFKVARRRPCGRTRVDPSYDSRRSGLTVGGGLIQANGKRKPGFYAFMRGGLTAAQRTAAGKP